MAPQAHSQITFRLPRKLALRLERMARITSRKRSEVLRAAAEAYLEVAEGTGPTRPATRVRDLLGSLRSGIPDLAERHGHYLKRMLRRGA